MRPPWSLRFCDTIFVPLSKERKNRAVLVSVLGNILFGYWALYEQRARTHTRKFIRKFGKAFITQVLCGIVFCPDFGLKTENHERNNKNFNLSAETQICGKLAQLQTQNEKMIKFDSKSLSQRD